MTDEKRNRGHEIRLYFAKDNILKELRKKTIKIE